MRDSYRSLLRVLRLAPWKTIAASALTLLLVTAPGTARAGCGCDGCTTGYDPGMVHRCVFSDWFTYAPDCPGVTRADPHWDYWSDMEGTSAQPGFSDFTPDLTLHNGINLGSNLQMYYYPPDPGIGLLVGMYILPGQKPPSGTNEVNLALNNTPVGTPLHNLVSHHTLTIVDHSGYYNAEYGVWFRNPANGINYVLNLVLPPNNPNTFDDGPGGHVIWHNCWHCNQPDQVNVIKLNGGAFGFPNVDKNGYQTFDIDWEALLGYVHGRGWWLDITPSITVDREWFQLQTWAVDSATAGGINTLQGNWTMSYK